MYIGREWMRGSRTTADSGFEVEPIVRQEGLGRSLSFSESYEHLCVVDVSRSDLAHRVGDAAAESSPTDVASLALVR